VVVPTHVLSETDSGAKISREGFSTLTNYNFVKLGIMCCHKTIYCNGSDLDLSLSLFLLQREFFRCFIQFLSYHVTPDVRMIVN
jgi:hypothetical protein